MCPLALPNVIAHAEWVLSALSGLGLDSVSMLHLHILMYSYVRGLAIDLEAELKATAETVDEHGWGESQVAAWQALSASGRYPTFAKLMQDTTSGYDLDLDAMFELGLSPVLDAFERWVAQRAARVSHPSPRRRSSRAPRG